MTNEKAKESDEREADLRPEYEAAVLKELLQRESGANTSNVIVKVQTW